MILNTDWYALHHKIGWCAAATNISFSPPFVFLFLDLSGSWWCCHSISQEIYSPLFPFVFSTMASLLPDIQQHLPDRRIPVLAFLAIHLPKVITTNHLIQPEKYISSSPPNQADVKEMLGLPIPSPDVVNAWELWLRHPSLVEESTRISSIIYKTTFTAHRHLQGLKKIGLLDHFANGFLKPTTLCVTWAKHQFCPKPLGLWRMTDELIEIVW